MQTAPGTIIRGISSPVTINLPHPLLLISYSLFYLVDNISNITVHCIYWYTHILSTFTHASANCRHSTATTIFSISYTRLCRTNRIDRGKNITPNRSVVVKLRSFHIFQNYYNIHIYMTGIFFKRFVNTNFKSNLL
jgi:hypothetical protein